MKFYSLFVLVFIFIVQPFSIDSRKAIAGELLDQIREKHKIILCAGPYAWPYTSSNNYPRGFDIEIIERIAANEDLYLDIYWAEQKMRGGLGKALRHSISKGRCHLYLGITTSDSMAEEIEEKNLDYTIPYMGVAYVPIANPEVPDFVKMEEIKGKYKPGVAMSTAIDGYLFYNGYDRDLWSRKPTEIDGVATQEISIAFVMSTQLAKAKRKYKDAPFRVIKSFEPPVDLRWNVAGVLPKGDKEFKNMINKNLKILIENGSIQEIVEKYKIPYFKPFDTVGSSYTAKE